MDHFNLRLIFGIYDYIWTSPKLLKKVFLDIFIDQQCSINMVIIRGSSSDLVAYV